MAATKTYGVSRDSTNVMSAMANMNAKKSFLLDLWGQAKSNESAITGHTSSCRAESSARKVTIR